jgi:hypothetical protein
VQASSLAAAAGVFCATAECAKNALAAIEHRSTFFISVSMTLRGNHEDNRPNMRTFPIIHIINRIASRGFFAAFNLINLS